MKFVLNRHKVGGPDKDSSLIKCFKRIKLTITEFVFGIGCALAIHGRVSLLSRLLVALVFLFSFQTEAQVSADIRFQRDTLHVELNGKESWDYQIKKINKQNTDFFELEVAPLSEKSRKEIQEFKSENVQKIEVKPLFKDQRDLIVFSFKENTFEVFDYLTDQPSRLILDFYPAPKSQVKTTPEESLRSAKVASKSNKVGQIASERLPASADYLQVSPQNMPFSAGSTKQRNVGILDGGDPDFDRFTIKDYEVKEEAIIASQENVYLEFPILKPKSHYLETILSKPPVYQIETQDTDENKQARLLLTLFTNKRFLIFLKTADWFFEKFPQSKYDEVIRAMFADSIFAIWMNSEKAPDFELAMARYRQFLEKYPQSILAERTAMLIGFATLNKGDDLQAIRLFQNHINSRPESPNVEISKLAMAEALLNMKKYDEALKTYSDVEKDSRQDKYRIKANYLKGDVFYQRGDYEAAIQHYKDSLSAHPAEKNQFPNALYNQASAYFWLGNYRMSLQVYNEFLKNFYQHEFAGYAMTRVGELLDILGADKSKVVGAYLETYFRYGENPGAVVARMRLLSSRMPGMKPKELERAVTEIDNLTANSKLSKIDQFAKVMIADGYAKRGEYDRSVDLMIKYYQAHPTSSDTQLLTNRIVKYINEDLRFKVKSGKFIDALKLHNQYATSWLKASNRMDTRYNVGRAFEQAGVFAEAEALYKDTINKLYSIKGTQAEKERNIFEQLPATDEVNLRLSSVSFSQGKFNQAYEFLKSIKNPEKLSESDQVERVVLASDILQRKGDFQAAHRYLVELLKAWRGIPYLVSDPYFNLAKLELKLDNDEEAIRSLKKIDELMIDSGKVNEEIHSKSLLLLSSLYEKKQKNDLAAQVYENLLNRYESKMPLSSARYKLGKIHFEKGELQKASNVWSQLKDSKESFWYKLSQEKLKDVDWKDNYNKYLRRIPAMETEGALE